MDAKKGRLVYSSGPAGSGDVPATPGAPAASEAAGKHDVRVRRETAGRGGKTVTTAGPFRLTRDDAAELLGRLKRLCGSGGTVKPAADGSAAYTLEVQGDHADRVLAALQKLGYRGKRAGG